MDSRIYVLKRRRRCYMKKNENEVYKKTGLRHATTPLQKLLKKIILGV